MFQVIRNCRKQKILKYQYFLNLSFLHKLSGKYNISLENIYWNRELNIMGEKMETFDEKSLSP